MSAIEFQAYPKIARLNRDITITEKIDGTNAAVVIMPLAEVDRWVAEDGVTTLGFFDPDRRNIVMTVGDSVVLAQSRTRFITPENDNYGFARWVRDNAEGLAYVLGEGRHFGEWWGAGIQRKYGLTGNDKRFSLFNTARWGDRNFDSPSISVPGLGVVPVLYEGLYDDYEIEKALDGLRDHGSLAAPGFMKPEGIVIYHEALRSSFKVTIENDAAPKGVSGHALDVEKVAA